MLIGTAVVGATTMVFGIIMCWKISSATSSTMLSIVQPEVILGLIMGGAVIYWFTGASCQAVVTGAYRAVVYIKEHMNSTPPPPPRRTARKSSASAPSMRKKACGTSSS